MVKKKKNGVSIQKTPRKEKLIKEKNEYVPVSPKGQENIGNIREVAEILEDMQSEESQGDRKRVETQMGMSSRGS